MSSHPLFRLLRKLDESGYHYALSRHRSDSVLVSITVVGERVEVDVLEDGSMEVCRFKGSEEIVGDEAVILALIAEHDRENEKG